MKQDKEFTRVVFRVFKDCEDVIALFPREPADRRGYECMSYVHVGQHGGACPTITRGGVTRLAKPEEYADLARELERIGYRLDIRTRITRHDTYARYKAART